MFICNQNHTISFLKEEFILRHNLPPMQAIIGGSLAQLFTLIMGPNNKEDHDKLKYLEKIIRQAAYGKHSQYKISIDNLVYRAVFKKLSDGKVLGNINKLDISSLPLTMTEATKKLSASVLSPPPQKTVRNTPKTLKNTQSKEKQNISLQNSEPKNFPRILVVDDSAVNREVVEIFLANDFPKIHYAENGQIALNILKSTPIDLVLMDVHMPIMNGVEATLAIRQLPKPLSDIIIIALTADTEYQLKRVYKNIGMNDAISKPVRYEILMQTIIRNWVASTTDANA